MGCLWGLPRKLLFIFLISWSAHSIAIGDLALSSLAQKGMHLEIIHQLQPEVSAGKDISSFQLLLLMGAYYESRQYRLALATADLMDKRFAEGKSASMFGADLLPYPQLVRAAVALDQGDNEATVRLAGAVLGQLNPNQAFYRQQVIMTCGLLGTAYAHLGLADDAGKCIERIRSIGISFSNLGPEKFTALARIYVTLKDYEKALEAINDRGAEVSDLLTPFYDQTFQQLPRFFIRAKSQFETRRVNEAKAAYDQLLKHPQIAQFGGIHWVVLYDRARIALQENDPAKAIGLLQQAVEIIERQRSSIDTEAGRIGFVGDKQAVYQLLVMLLVDAERKAEAFEFVERSKARALVDLLASQRNFRPSVSGGDAGGALQNLASAESALVALTAPDDAAGAAQRRSLLIEAHSELQRQAPELAALVSVSGVPVKVIQGLLAKDEALLEYFYSERDLIMFLVTGEEIKAVRLERAKLEQDVAAFRQCLEVPESTSCVMQAQQLYARLFQPVVAALNVARLIVVPHGVLHYLPFSALHNGTAYLVDDYSIRVEPSASVLELIKGRPSQGPMNALILGNPDLGKPEFSLRHAEEEAAAIAKLFRDALVLLRSSATRSAVTSQGERYALLHFATHGIFEDKAPLNSALLLSPDADSDGRLTVGDLYALRLNADLVTLSACETALGHLASGDDIVGFTRGLLYAGARSIVSSLWSVDDLATRDLMVSFYSGLRTLDKREALRQAQLAVKKSRPHPFYWAAFILTGRAD